MMYTSLLLAVLCFSLTSTTDLNPRIINGTDASKPTWVVSLADDEENPSKSDRCAGSLVAPNWVLTAKSCIMHKVGNAVSVNSVSYGNGQLIAVGEVHPYDDENDKTADLALLKLEETVDISPIKVQYEDDIKYDGRQATVYGWGQTETGDFPDQLKTTNVILYSRDQCSDNSVCSNPKLTNSIVCKGDKGGPLVIEENNEFMLIGVARVDRRCNSKRAFYTSTAYYSDWIKATIG